MTRLASWLVVALVLCGIAFVAATSGSLPPRVATHFGHGGAANGWMTRDGYTWFMLLLVVLLPLVLFGALGYMPARFDRFVNLPHREYWLAPQRRTATLASLRGYAAALGIATALLMIGAHAAILDANAQSPPRLDEAAFIAGLACFVVFLLAVVIAMHAKFRRTPGPR